MPLAKLLGGQVPRSFSGLGHIPWLNPQERLDLMKAAVSGTRAISD
jgi:hypothetical protein